MNLTFFQRVFCHIDFQASLGRFSLVYKGGGGDNAWRKKPTKESNFLKFQEAAKLTSTRQVALASSNADQAAPPPLKLKWERWQIQSQHHHDIYSRQRSYKYFWQRCSMEALPFKLLISWLICIKFHSLLMLLMLLMLFTVLNQSLGDMSSLKRTPCKTVNAKIVWQYKYFLKCKYCFKM